MNKLENYFGGQPAPEFEKLGKEEDFKSLEEMGSFKEGESFDASQIERITADELSVKLYEAETKLGLLKEQREETGPRYIPHFNINDEIEFLELEVKTLQERIKGIGPLAEKIDPKNLKKLIDSEAYKN